MLVVDGELVISLVDNELEIVGDTNIASLVDIKVVIPVVDNKLATSVEDKDEDKDVLSSLELDGNNSELELENDRATLVPEVEDEDKLTKLDKLELEIKNKELEEDASVLSSTKDVKSVVEDEASLVPVELPIPLLEVVAMAELDVARPVLEVVDCTDDKIVKDAADGLDT